MKRVDEGDRVKLSCVGQLENKAHLGTTRKRILEFKVGSNSVLAGLEKGVLGMAVGEKKASPSGLKKGTELNAQVLSRKCPKAVSQNILICRSASFSS